MQDSSATATTPLVRTLLVLIALLVGVIVGEAGGILAAVGGATLTTAFTTGGVAFAGTTTLALVILKSLGVL